MTDRSPIERVVMRRVHTIRLLRPLFSGGALAALIFVAALWGIGREVWVARVIENMPQPFNLAAEERFFLFAFQHTSFLVQALALATFASLVYLARETARMISSLVALVPLKAR